MSKTDEKCPHCGARLMQYVTEHESRRGTIPGANHFYCRTSVSDDGTILQSQSCLRNERDLLATRNKTLEESIPMLVQIAVQDAKAGHDPSIYKRGDVWRYHLDRASNDWNDDANPEWAASACEGRTP